MNVLEYLQECKELNNSLVQFLVCVGQRSRQNQSQVLQQLMAFVVEHLNWKMTNVSTLHHHFDIMNL